MGYIQYHTNAPKVSIRFYKTEKGAKIGTRAANRNAGSDVYFFTHEDDFYDRRVTVKSLMTGQDVEIAATTRGTCCDPSTERYWSM